MELLLAIAQHAGQPHIRDEAPLLLSLFYHLYNNVDPEKMLSAKWTKSISQSRQPPKQAVLASMVWFTGIQTTQVIRVVLTVTMRNRQIAELKILCKRI